MNEGFLTIYMYLGTVSLSEEKRTRKEGQGGRFPSPALQNQLVEILLSLPVILCYKRP